MRTSIGFPITPTRLLSDTGSKRAEIGRSPGAMAQPVTPRLARSLVAPTLAVLALVLVLISGTFAVLLVSVSDFGRESRSAGRAERILSISAAVERHVVDVETGLRGYLLTGDP